MKRILLFRTALIILALILCIGLTACGSNDSASGTDAEENAGAEDTASDTSEENGAADPENIIIDADAGTVTITARLNGKYFDHSTMHCIVWKDGGVSKKAMMTAYCSFEDVYNALIEAGGTPWNTTDDKIKKGELTDGQKVDVTLRWDGNDTPVSLADCIRTDDGKLNIDMRFSGNLENNRECGSGCICCLNSCWAGITSNASYGFDAIDSGNVKAYLDDSVMPADGTDIQVTFVLR